MKIFLTLVSLILGSCGKNNIPINKHEIHVDQELQGYVVEFIDAMQKRDKKIRRMVETITMEESFSYITGANKEAVGVCLPGKWIKILKRDVPEIRYRQVMFHEMGHCFLGLGHDESGIINIMNPSEIWDINYMNKNWELLVDNMFNQKPSLFLTGEESDGKVIDCGHKH